MFDDINKDLDRLWAEYSNTAGLKLRPTYLHSKSENSIVFVGINQSFVESKIDDTLRIHKIPTTASEFYSVGSNQYCAKLDHTIERHHWMHYPFFDPHRKLSEELGFSDWYHLDAFFVRETDQGKIKTLMKKHSEFFRRQFELFCVALARTKPKAVIVLNAFASELIETKFQPVWSDAHGHHVLTTGGLTCPLFLSGMLTGGATDRYSRQRLFWIIKKALSHEAAQN